MNLLDLPLSGLGFLPRKHGHCVCVYTYTHTHTPYVYMYIHTHNYVFRIKWISAHGGSIVKSIITQERVC